MAPLAFPTLAALTIPVDVQEGEQSYLVRADIPGVRRQDIYIAVDGNEITLHAEAKQERSRSFSLPMDVDAAAAKAQYEDGVLNLVLPKKAA